MADLEASNAPIQVEATRTRSGVSESLLQAIGGNINYLLASILPVGSVIASMLTEAQFQDEASDAWELADGGDCTGSAYALVTGFTTKPDLRGRFIRGKNHARSTSTGNAAGDLTLGQAQDDLVGPHTHVQKKKVYDGNTDVNGPFIMSAATDGNGSNNSSHSTDTNSGAETRPRNVTMNLFIRIN